MSPVAIVGRGTVGPLAGHGDVPLAIDGLPPALHARALRAERVTQLAMLAVDAAMTEARVPTGSGLSPRTGIVLGTGLGCFLTNLDYERRLLAQGPSGASPRLFAATVSNAAAGEVSIAYGLGGPAVTITAGLAAGAVALGHALDLFAVDAADVLVVGAVDASGAGVARFARDGGFAADARAADAAAVVVLVRAPRDSALGYVVAAQSGFSEGTRVVDDALTLADSALGAAAQTWSAIQTTIIVAADRGAREGIAAGVAARAGGQTGVVAADADGLGASGMCQVVALTRTLPAGSCGVVIEQCSRGHLGVMIVRAGGGR